MARRSAPGTLIHCDACGEDYSATYKRCPFCGEKPNKEPTAPLPPLDEDDFVFEGSDVFEDSEPQEKPTRPKGGKRLAQEDAPGPINWPRLITFICSLIIVAAALVIVFAYVYPKIHNPDSTHSDQVSQAPESSAPVESEPEESGDVPATDDPVEPTDDVPSQDPEPSNDVGSVTGLSLSNVEFTLPANDSYTIEATVTPSDWSGTVSWSSSNTSIATVNQNGTVTNVNTSSSVLRVTITATAGGQTATATVYCRGGSADPDPSTSSSPSGGTLTLNRTDFTLYISENQIFTMVATGADSVTWSVSDSSVATISDSGVVTPVATGQATITCTASDGRTATCIVRIRD